MRSLALKYEELVTVIWLLPAIRLMLLNWATANGSMSFKSAETWAFSIYLSHLSYCHWEHITKRPGTSWTLQRYSLADFRWRNVTNRDLTNQRTTNNSVTMFLLRLNAKLCYKKKSDRWLSFQQVLYALFDNLICTAIYYLRLLFEFKATAFV